MKLILIIFLLIFPIFFSCSAKTSMPKATIVRDTERILQKAEKSLTASDMDSKELIETALSLSIATNIPDLKIKALLLKVNYELRENKIEDAIKTLNKAKELSIKENPVMISHVKYYEMLIAYLTKDNETLNSLLKETENYTEDVLCGINILKALIFVKSKKLDLAERYANASLKISDKKNFLVEKSFSIKILSYIYLQKNNLEKAQSLINESLVIDRSLNLLDYIYWDLEFLAKIYLIKGENENALYYYKSAYELALSNKNQAKSSYFKSIIDNLLK